ncbi:DUF1330 domain-containing protein [Confluentibacter lentus]|uniref:DUF1330 domain-containing protein n=1 Tax=Confluentibacter lentus TaxID=1699412 RepID=UPI000C28344C|nr:DUF1330 domain-containing protein [Confluentibacter lentus]
MIYLTVLIHIKEGKEEIFHQYESLVLPILNDYNGKLIYRIRPANKNFIKSEGEPPYELHFISFNTNEDFKNFVGDTKRKSFEYLKEDSIKSTFLVQGEKI